MTADNCHCWENDANGLTCRLHPRRECKIHGEAATIALFSPPANLLEMTPQEQSRAVAYEHSQRFKEMVRIKP